MNVYQKELSSLGAYDVVVFGAARQVSPHGREKRKAVFSKPARGLRVMPRAMATGQAAGAAMSIALKKGCRLEGVSADELRRLLLEHGAISD